MRLRAKKTKINPILDGPTAADKLRAAMAAERELLIVDNLSGKREYVQTGKHAAAMVEALKAKRIQLVRSKSLDGGYYLGLFDYQKNLRILVCRSRTIPSAPAPYRLLIKDKEVVSENIESAEQVYGSPAVICVCTTTATPLWGHVVDDNFLARFANDPEFAAFFARK